MERRRPMRNTYMARFGSIDAVVRLPDRNILNRSLPEAKEIVMSRIRRICRWARRLAGLASVLRPAGEAVPAALANRAVGPA
jgi:hypothetical protein